MCIVIAAISIWLILYSLHNICILKRLIQAIKTSKRQNIIFAIVYSRISYFGYG